MAIKIDISNNANELGFKIANHISQIMVSKPTQNPVLGLCASSFSSYIYQSLIAKNMSRQLDFSRTTVFSLAEYVGVDPNRRPSWKTFLYENLCGRVNMNPNYLRSPLPYGQNMQMNCAAYENEITQFGGLDLVLMELGTNGEINFRSSMQTFQDPTALITMGAEDMMISQQLFAQSGVPLTQNRVISVGLNKIMSARNIIIYAIGANKAPVVANLLFSQQVIPNFVATILQQHPNVYLYFDVPASSIFYQRRQQMAQQIQMQQQAAMTQQFNMNNQIPNSPMDSQMIINSQNKK